MRLAARVYVTVQGCADEAGALAARTAIADELAALLDDGLLTGYEVMDVATPEDAEYADIDLEAADRVVAGRRPFVFATLGYDADDPRQAQADHGALLRRHGLELASEVTPADG